MKKRFKLAKFANVMACFAMLGVVITPRVGFCTYLFHEPKMPESLKKLQ